MSSQAKAKYKLLVLRGWETGFKSQSSSSQPPTPFSAVGHGIALAAAQAGAMSTVLPTSSNVYQSYMRDSQTETEFMLAVYPVARAYALKELDGMQRNTLSTKIEWPQPVLRAVQRSIEEVNEKDGLGPSTASSNSSSQQVTARSPRCWELCGFRDESAPGYIQVSILLELLSEAAGSGGSSNRHQSGWSD
ncbi:hypothetical protein BDZ91DRAFT_763292 [Kalaharituber pfeilii]|nr:hypothetical protein BDZ91DRAFT_763292 [Kalaharituber pfeilii]